jgi:Domain of unknown function (DUF4342)
MSESTWYETIRAEGGQVVDKVRDALREGNVRRVIIRQGNRSIAEFPLTIGVVGMVFAPMLAAIGAIVALATDCSIEVERVATQTDGSEKPADAETAQPAGQAN